MLGTSMTPNGQVTVPKEVRDTLGLGAGDKVYFIADTDRAIMVPLKGDLWSVRGALRKYAKGKPFDWKTIRKQVSDWRGKKHAEKLGQPRRSSGVSS